MRWPPRGVPSGGVFSHCSVVLLRCNQLRDSHDGRDSSGVLYLLIFVAAPGQIANRNSWVRTTLPDPAPRVMAIPSYRRERAA
jgi:hypothetical protein